MAKTTDREEREAQREGAHRQIIPVVGDEDMVEWLEGLFNLSPKPEGEGARVTKPKPEPDSFPERIVLRPIYGVGGRDKGDPIGKPREWKPTQSPVPAPEEIVKMANSFLTDAQRECNVHQRQQRFALFASSSLKGPEHYARYPFVLVPTGKEWGKGSPSASDSEDTHRDRIIEAALLQSAAALAHVRWESEQNIARESSIMELQQEMIREQRLWSAQLEADRRALIIASEQALSLKAEREEKIEAARFKREAIAESLKMLAGFVPSVHAYLTGKMQQKVDVAADLGKLLASFNPQEKLALFGAWNENDECMERGIFDPPHVKLMLEIVEGKEPPARFGELVASLRMEQMQAAQQILKPSQLQQLAAIAKAASALQQAQEAAA